MLHTPRGTRGAVVAPHNLAAQAGLAVLREGGNAIEAMVAAAGTVAVVYPHMNSIGGDNFWLIAEPGRGPVAIMACGGAGKGRRRSSTVGTRAFRRAGRWQRIRWRERSRAGRARWRSADVGAGACRRRILADAIEYARNGVPVTVSQHKNTAAKLAELKDVPGYAAQFLVNGEPPAVGSLFRQPTLAATLERLAAVASTTSIEARSVTPTRPSCHGWEAR